MLAPGRPSEATQVARLPGPFTTEAGAVLPGIDVAYRTWGTLDEDGANAVLVCHALTGSADADAWWPGLLGEGAALDPRHDFIVCSNVLGGCYGSTGPVSPRPGGAGWWGPDFPVLSVRDLVHAQRRLLAELGVRRLRLVVGGSLGGMQVLEWAALYPEFVAATAPIAVSGRHSAWCIGWSEAQRQALAVDPLWNGGRYRPESPPRAGLAAARRIAMCTYRSQPAFEGRFARSTKDGRFAIEDWLDFHGRALVERFDANTYVGLTRTMDTHDLARGRGDYATVLRGLAVPALVVAIDSDALYVPAEQQELAAGMPHAELATLHSPHGHDAFLIEIEELGAILRGFRSRVA